MAALTKAQRQFVSMLEDLCPHLDRIALENRAHLWLMAMKAEGYELKR